MEPVQLLSDPEPERYAEVFFGVDGSDRPPNILSLGLKPTDQTGHKIDGGTVAIALGPVDDAERQLFSLTPAAARDVARILNDLAALVDRRARKIKQGNKAHG